MTTKDSTKRFKAHLWIAETTTKKVRKQKIHKAISKDGKENFRFTVLEKCDTFEELVLLEKKWISFHKSFGKHGYNLTDGGEGRVGWSMSDDQKNKLRTLRLGTQHSDDAKKKMSEARIGKGFSESHRKSLSKAQLGQKNHRYGRKHTEEEKQQIANTMMGELNHFYGKTHNDATKRKISERNKGRYSGANNPAARVCMIHGKRYATGKELREIEQIKLSKFYSLLKQGIIRYEDNR